MTATATTIEVVIEGRFNGPPDTANGGYACGLLAQTAASWHGKDVAVTILAPPPLNTPLEFRPGARRSTCCQGDDLIATVMATSTPSPVPSPVSVAAAAAASRHYAGHRGHPFPTCFACGVDRSDGLGLAPGPLDRPGTVACVWIPADAVPVPVLWSVLDCPGGWTGDPVARPVVLSRMSATLLATPVPGRPHVVVAAAVRDSGRTSVRATAVYTDSGRLVAHARAVWTAVDH